MQRSATVTTMATQKPLSDEQVRVYTLFLRARHLVIVLSGVAAFVNPDLGPRAAQVAFGLWFAMLPYNELIVRLTRSRRRVPAAVGWIDLVGVLAACLYEPTLFAPGLILALGNLPLPAAVLPLRQAVAVGVAALGGFVAVAVIVDTPSPWSMLIAFGLAVPVMYIVVILLARRDVVETRRRTTVLDGTGAISWEFDLVRATFTFVSGPTQEVLGLSQAEWLRDRNVVLDLVHPDDRALLTRSTLVSPGVHHRPVEVRVLRAGALPADAAAWSWWRVVGVELDGAERLSGMFINVTDLHRAHDAMREQAMSDLLTGLPNRASIVREVEALCTADRSLGLILIDIDRFKEVNDALGHHVGDRLLCGIADRLRDLAGVATSGRLGGDEFAVVFADDRAASAVDHATDIHHHLTQAFDTDGMSLVVGASLGVARRSSDCDTVESLFRGADAAMYQAKRAGGGVVEFVAGATRDSSRSVRLLSDLHRRLLVDGLDVVLQPIVSASTGEIVGAEALARWDHHELGAISPAEFIPLAEMSGQIQRVAQSVLRQAITYAAGWRARGHPLDVSVNLSATNLLSADVIGVIERLPEELGLPWSSLVLEITETQAMEQSDLVAHALDRFTNLGVRLSIDDFGTGHSSLGRLRQMPFSELKVDRSFIAGLGSEGFDATIVAAIVGVGHGVGMTVVAEGVETAAEILAAKALGCDLLQGFGLHRPMRNEALVALLDERQLTGVSGGASIAARTSTTDALGARHEASRQT